MFVARLRKTLKMSGAKEEHEHAGAFSLLRFTMSREELREHDLSEGLMQNFVEDLLLSESCSTRFSFEVV